MTDPKSDRPVRSGLQRVIDSRAAILDDARPKAVAQQRKRGPGQGQSAWRSRVEAAFTLALAAYNLVRLPKLLVGLT